MVKEDLTTTETKHETIEYLLQTKFPRAEITNYPSWEFTEEVPTKTNKAEITKLLKKCNNKSAPGLDGIRWKHIKILNKNNSDLVLKLMNACLEFHLFPKPWKKGKVVFLKKPGKKENSPNAYRPLSLRSNMGKLLEKIITLNLPKNLNDRQFGFRKRKSAEECVMRMTEELKIKIKNKEVHYLAIISIDIKGAFDHMEWPRILEALINKNTNHNIIKMIES